jgi:hypothetical protein
VNHIVAGVYIYLVTIAGVFKYDRMWRMIDKLMQHMYRRFEHVLSKLGRVEKTERLIIYLNKLNWFTEMYLPTMSNTQMLSLSNTESETNRDALVPVQFSTNLPRKTSTNSTASSTSDVSCRSNPDVPSYSSNTNMSSQISSKCYWL